MTEQEIEQYEQCVNHVNKEQGGYRTSAFNTQPQMSMNVFEEGLSLDTANDQNAWFDDVHNYGPI